MTVSSPFLRTFATHLEIAPPRNSENVLIRRVSDIFETSVIHSLKRSD